MMTTFSSKVLLLALVIFFSFCVNFGSAQNTTQTCETQGCANCTVMDGCVWCSTAKQCFTWDGFLGNTTQTNICNNSYCIGSACDPDMCEEPCTSSIWPCSTSVVGLIILMIFYGVLLGVGAKLISEGSELLLEILDPGVIGGLVLPILGAVPDAAIVVVSGVVGSRATAQDQLRIGVGTLAGSTIMLLTIPWSVCIWLARTDIRGGESVDGVLTKGCDPVQTGTSVDDSTPINAKIMVATSVSYLIVQGVAFAYLKDPWSGEKVERWFALAGFIFCFAALIAYCAYQVLSPTLQKKKIAEARRKYTAGLFMKKLVALQSAVERTEEGSAESSRLLGSTVQEEQSVDIRATGLKWKAAAKKKAEAIAKPTTHHEEEEEKEEGPPNKLSIAIKASPFLLAGVAVVSVFSDPMVTVIGDFGTAIHLKNPFYVAFIITPICSNASETISSLIFSSKKRKVNSSLTYGQLYGAATMNNTLVLGIFFALVFFRELTWIFSAETLAILFVTVAVGIIGSIKTTYETYWGFLVLMLYPLSLVLVFLLETFAHWQ